MKLRRKRKTKYIYLLLLLIIYLFIKLGNNITRNVTSFTKIKINNIIDTSINEAINQEYLSNINNLIIINYNNNEISSIDYNLEYTYLLLSKIKKNLINILDNKYKMNDNILILKEPIFNYTNNIFLIKLSPKINIKIDLLKSIDTYINTEVNNYGINTTKLDIYINFRINSNIIVPLNKNNIINNYKILITSKVINGKIPEYYNSGYSSDILNLQ